MSSKSAVLAKVANGDMLAYLRDTPKKQVEADKVTSLMNFIAENPNTTDADIHALAERMKVDPHLMEEEVYKTLSALLKGRKNDVIAGGLAAGKPNSDFPEAQIEKGTEVEKEHTPSTAVATEIAKDHLVESDKYYDHLEDMEEGMEGDGKNDSRKAAFKYGFFSKIAELGLTPGEMTKLALTGPIMAAGAAGKAGETASGLGRWTLDKALSTLKLGAKTPLILAPVLGMLAGGAYRGLTAPKFETPEDLRTTERLALYRRLAREALKAAQKKQRKRLSMTGAKEQAIEVPALAG